MNMCGYMTCMLYIYHISSHSTLPQFPTVIHIFVINSEKKVLY